MVQTVTRWMLTLTCEVCNLPIKRSVQDVLAKDIKKSSDVCPRCGSVVTWKKNLLPKDMESLKVQEETTEEETEE